MIMKIEKIKPGMKLFSVSKGKMGNTTLTTISVHPVSVIEVNVEKRTVTASWNSNAARIYRENSWSKWRAKQPHLIRSGMGCARLAAREEIKQIQKNEDIASRSL